MQKTLKISHKRLKISRIKESDRVSSVNVVQGLGISESGGWIRFLRREARGKNKNLSKRWQNKLNPWWNGIIVAASDKICYGGTEKCRNYVNSEALVWNGRSSVWGWLRPLVRAIVHEAKWQQLTRRQIKENPQNLTQKPFRMDEYTPEGVKTADLAGDWRFAV